MSEKGLSLELQHDKIPEKNELISAQFIAKKIEELQELDY